MNYEIKIVIPLNSEESLDAATLGALRSNAEHAIGQAYGEGMITGDVGWNEELDDYTISAETPQVTVQEVAPQIIYALTHLRAGQVGLMGLFGSLEGAQKQAFEHAQATASDDGEAAPLSLGDLIWTEYDTEPEQPKAVASEWGNQVFVIETQEVQA